MWEREKKTNTRLDIIIKKKKKKKVVYMLDRSSVVLRVERH